MKNFLKRKITKLFFCGVLIITLVSSLLAFSIKADNFCYYEKSLQGICVRVQYIASFTSNNFGGQSAIRPLTNCPTTIPCAECTRQVNGIVID